MFQSYFRNASSFVRSSSVNGFQSIVTEESEVLSAIMSASEMSMRRSSSFLSRGNSFSRCIAASDSRASSSVSDSSVLSFVSTSMVESSRLSAFEPPS